MPPSMVVIGVVWIGEQSTTNFRSSGRAPARFVLLRLRVSRFRENLARSAAAIARNLDRVEVRASVDDRGVGVALCVASQGELRRCPELALVFVDDRELDQCDVAAGFLGRVLPVDEPASPDVHIAARRIEADILDAASRKRGSRQRQQERAALKPSSAGSLSRPKMQSIRELTAAVSMLSLRPSLEDG